MCVFRAVLPWSARYQSGRRERRGKRRRAGSDCKRRGVTEAAATSPVNDPDRTPAPNGRCAAAGGSPFACPVVPLVTRPATRYSCGRLDLPSGAYSRWPAGARRSVPLPCPSTIEIVEQLPRYHEWFVARDPVFGEEAVSWFVRAGRLRDEHGRLARAAKALSRGSQVGQKTLRNPLGQSDGFEGCSGRCRPPLPARRGDRTGRGWGAVVLEGTEGGPGALARAGVRRPARRATRGENGGANGVEESGRDDEPRSNAGFDSRSTLRSLLVRQPWPTFELSASKR